MFHIIRCHFIAYTYTYEFFKANILHKQSK